MISLFLVNLELFSAVVSPGRSARCSLSSTDFLACGSMCSPGRVHVHAAWRHVEQGRSTRMVSCVIGWPLSQSAVYSVSVNAPRRSGPRSGPLRVNEVDICAGPPLPSAAGGPCWPIRIRRPAGKWIRPHQCGPWRHADLVAAAVNSSAHVSV